MAGAIVGWFVAVLMGIGAVASVAAGRSEEADMRFLMGACATVLAVCSLGVAAGLLSGSGSVGFDTAVTAVPVTAVSAYGVLRR